MFAIPKNNRLKKAGVLFLLFTFILHSVGGLMIYNIRLLNIKEQMEKTIHSKNIVLETITVSNVFYKNHVTSKNEIRIHGYLYDIKSFKQTHSITKLFVLKDSKEDKLERDFKNLKNKSKSAKENNLKYFFSKNNFQDLKGIEFCKIESTLPSTLCLTPNKNIELGKIPSPPPELI